MSEQTAVETNQATLEPEWIVYQIGGPDRGKFRFIISRGFQDMAVTAALKPFEFIDTTTTLLGEFGGDVTVLGFDELLAGAEKAKRYMDSLNARRFLVECDGESVLLSDDYGLTVAINKARGKA